ncbi:FG-GAP repeat domain-containing protein [Flexithrix dorotheae]|uniref:FG-GAP repeat domain-containing protein n=1 Tax=Flexithrix dorotheae TaxID=70993 RepID=UPI0003724ED2|nr:VCBS repeat-containing protein [Flexithrix dorotheae]
MQFILYFFLAILLVSCNNPAQDSTIQEVNSEEEINGIGETLSRQYCGSCHLYPEPELLDKNTWKYSTLPQMGYRMGIYGDISRQSLIEKGQGGRLVERKNIYPHKPILDEEQWEFINEFYVKNAPDSLSVPSLDLKSDLSGLKVKTPDFHISPPMVTAIQYQAELKQLFVADAKADYSTINILDQSLSSISTLAIPSPISHIEFSADTILATLMGGFMPTDNPDGSIIKIFKVNGQSEYKGFTSLIKNLQRPVFTEYTDINGDNLDDIIVCEYGNHTGKLSLFIKQVNGQYQKKILSNDPGASKAIIRDINRDGLLDIIVLMSQGNERIDVYYNQGDGNFKMENLLMFPPSYGSVFISMLDWNQDGFEDIIYVNGDNADYSMVLKPYHGVHIFLNDGANKFQEAFFQHLNGAYKAIADDFDKDGDLDIATISFFPDLIRTSKEGFVFMENISKGDSILFELKSINQASTGRWLIMESVDFENDDSPELVLGSFTGMAIQGDNSGEYSKRLISNSPTIILIQFDQFN